MKLKLSLDWLLIFLPIAVVLEVAHKWWHASWASPTAIFICSAVAIIPAAGWMGRATEHLAERLGEGVGGLLNATFGNAAELIIAFMALLEAARRPGLRESMHAIVKASLTGSIIGNILLVQGLSLLVGGLRHRLQIFNITAARTGATLLLLSVTAIMLPAVFHSVVAEAGELRDLSFEISVILLAVYALSLVFTLRTHRHLYLGQEQIEGEAQALAAEPSAGLAPPGPGSQSSPSAQERRSAAPAAAAHGHGAASGRDPKVGHWSIGKSVAVLILATVVVALVAEFMIGSVDEASRAIGLTELFVGVIVVAIVGNAAEHSTAVLVAWRNRMDLSLSIAIGSSIQIALLVAPLLVLVSAAMGSPMDLLFTMPEIVAIVIAVLVTNQIAGDGRSHWLEGVMLLTVYVFLGVLFFHLPG